MLLKLLQDWHDKKKNRKLFVSCTSAWWTLQGKTDAKRQQVEWFTFMGIISRITLPKTPIMVKHSAYRLSTSAFPLKKDKKILQGNDGHTDKWKKKKVEPSPYLVECFIPNWCSKARHLEWKRQPPELTFSLCEYLGEQEEPNTDYGKNGGQEQPDPMAKLNA